MLKSGFHIALWGVLFCILAGPISSYAQYGLAFASHEVVLDQRTGIDLSEGTSLCFRNEVELSFDLSFLRNHVDYFGYVVRIIINDQTNIDLLYDRQDSIEHHFRIVLGEQFSSIAFNIDSVQLFHEWNRIRIKVNPSAGKLTVSCADKVFSESIDLPRRNCLKVLFGDNNYREFKTNDVPPMKIRDVRLIEGGKLVHHWPFDEETGNRIADAVKGTTAVISNPHWIKRRHYEWELLNEVRIGGQASTAFDPRTERIFVVGRDSLVQFHVPSGQRQNFKYAEGPLWLINGSQSFFDTTQNQLLNISIDQHKVSVFDSKSLTWSENFTYPGVGTSYLHFNKFYSPVDSSLYFVNGYGHFEFRNEIHRYTLDGRWLSVEPEGDTLTPRYLAALGATANGAYILGGYGSVSGQQMLNPRNLYDLLFFDSNKRTLSKRYEFDPGEEDFVWSNSLVIDEAADQFYGLTFPKHQYNANLQLVAGSLSQPDIKKLGGHIPYLFHDIRSFADLYYFPDSKRFVAVTLYHDEEDVTTAKIYSLYDPPLAHNATKAHARNEWFVRNVGYLGLGLGVLALVGGYLIIRKKRKRAALRVDTQPLTVTREEKPQHAPVFAEKQRQQNSIFLFGGDLQLFDTVGTDITRNFTPLIKELFLVILLHTIRWGRGISSEKLTEQFWFDKSVESARNNRSVNIAKINTILEKMGDAKVSKQTGYWRFEAADTVFIDYQNYLAIVNNKGLLDKARVKELSAIVQRGGFLSETDYEWLDSFKADVSIQVINTYMRYAENARIADDPEFMIELANNIFFFDPVHEEAMIIKCKALAAMGNHSLATQTFDSFCNEYRQIYGEGFAKDYKTILS